MRDNMSLLIVGAGPMAVAYANVLKSLEVHFDVSGRGALSAKNFKDQTGIAPVPGGIDEYFSGRPIPDAAIVATGVEAIAGCSECLIKKGVKNILVEKPGGLNLSQLIYLKQLAEEKNARVIVGYNRRYYSSVARAKQIIEEDGGLREVYFEFTEWSNIIEPLKKAEGIKQKWFLANSTHVVDLAFHLAGTPERWQHIASGGNSWHPTATRFVGSGVTKKNVLFTYAADWEAPGRWGLELLTKHRRIILRPIENLAVQRLASINIELENINDVPDKQFKPGLLQQVQAFINGDDSIACSLEEQCRNYEYYKLMAGYTD
jgi:predicted dehydrogenase